VCSLAGSLGLQATRIDLAGCRDKETFLERTAAALDFPDWFGRNWDAFYDCLADLGWRPGGGYLLVFEHAGDMRRDAPEALDTAISILGDAAAAWARRGVPFRALVGA
jgi:RNAse (barnase) inhibitor barstar